MKLVQLKPGRYHGKDKEHGPGDRIKVTDAEFLAFGDKFISLGSTVTPEDLAPLTPAQGITVNPNMTDPDAVETAILTEVETAVSPPPETEPETVTPPETAVSLEGLSVSDILAKVEAGELSAQAALEAENATGKPRKSLLAGLERHLGA